jgi:hypothetical protein
MMLLLHKAHQLALDVCQEQVSNPSGLHYRFKAVGKRRRKLMNTLKKTRALRKQMREGTGDEMSVLDFIRQARADLQAQEQHQKQPSNNAQTQPTTAGTVPEEHTAQAEPGHAKDLTHIAQQVDTAIKTLDADHARLDRQTYKDKMDKLLEQQPKKGHKAIFGSAEPRQELTTVTDPYTGCPTSDTTRVQQVLETHYREQLKAPTWCWLQVELAASMASTYQRRPHSRNYPWQSGGKGDIETFHLQTDETEPRQRKWLAEYATDEAVFFECLKSLSSGKAPGPDKIGNELLKMLPVQVKKLIHMLFTLMWVTGVTSDAWKHSETCLIYKIGDPTQVGNYRPIGLANTVYNPERGLSS